MIGIFIQKARSLIFALVPLSLVSPNTLVERTEENNHPTPLSCMDIVQGNTLVHIRKQQKGHSPLCSSTFEIGDFEIKNFKLNAFCTPTDFSPLEFMSGKIANFCENVPKMR